MVVCGGRRPSRGPWTDSKSPSAWRRKTCLQSLEGILDWGGGLGGLGGCGTAQSWAPGFPGGVVKSPHTGRPSPWDLGAETGLCCGESLKGENCSVTATGPSQQMTSRPPALNRLPRGGPHPQRPHHLPSARTGVQGPWGARAHGAAHHLPQSPAQEAVMTPFPARSTLTPELDPTCPDQEQM